MSGILTRAQLQYCADQFKYAIETGLSTLYLFIGKAVPWADENNPDTPIDCAHDSDQAVWKDIISMKKVVASNLSYAIPRYNWANNTVYTPYSDTSAYWSGRFYVVTPDFNVYKCLDNNSGLSSTVIPTGRSNSSFFTSDNYQWKFMYTIGAADANKFLTSSFVPIKVVSTNDGSYQYGVQTSAANCSIETYKLTANGSGYPTHSGTAVTANTTTITLASGASATGGKYVGSAIYITGGTGVGQLRNITGYNGVTKKAVVSGWSVTPDGTSTYLVSPAVNVAGDGSSATAYSLMAGSAISRIKPVTIGHNYSYANVTFTSNTGSGAAATAVIAPRGGHGANAVFELGGRNVIFQVTLNGSESSTIIANNTFRQVGLLLNPQYKANNSILSATTYDVTTTFHLTGVTGTFVEGEYVTGGTSGARGYVLKKSAANTLIMTSIAKTFVTTELVTGATSSAHGTINTISSPTVRAHTGRITYLENRESVQRASTQEEDFRLVLEF